MNCELNTYHVPVMLEECLEGLNIKPNGVYVDVTFGGGGHSRAILERLGDGGHLYSFDQDLDAAKNAFEDDRFTFVRSNFRYLKNFLRYHGVEKVDGILADLGVSSHHLDDETRGFSFRFEGQLDMRMNTAAGKTAADVLNEYSEEELANVFYFYGELQQARKLAKAIVKARGEEGFSDIARFMEVVKPFFKHEREKKDLAKVFQALRIDVNSEFEVLYAFLEKLPGILKPGARVAILTFHSGEDQLVKKSFKQLKKEGVYSDASEDVIRPSAAECQRNPRAKSTKLRWAVKA